MDKVADILYSLLGTRIDTETNADSFSANDYKNCSFVISDKHLKLQWIKGLKRLSFKPFFLSVEILQHVYKITNQNLL